MTLLDTDHLSVLHYPESAAYASLRTRLEAAGQESFATTVVSVEEQLRGWLAYLGRFREVHKQVPAYERLVKLFLFLSPWEIIIFDTRAADMFQHLRKQRVRIGTQDLKIAAIALVHNARLLSANLRDFQQVPALQVENWL